MTTTERSRPSPAYALILPPGFVLIPTRGDVAATVRAKVRALYDTLDDRTRGRLALAERKLAEYATNAGRRGVVDIVLPVSNYWNAPLSIGMGFGPARPDTDPGGTVVRTRAGSALRSVDERPKVPEFETAKAPDGSAMGDGRTVWRTVHHVWKTPDAGAGLLLGTFSVSGDGDPGLAPLADALTELGDTIMGSLAWTGLDDAPPAEPVQGGEQ
ncbi:hypothetical protein [Promicromonospora aerolata]|uniref:Uncharacterized protein n=1 Tax=Promicromonospora aerolata TaxID=195749 RepID=A0ABW4VCP9_9MICO